MTEPYLEDKQKRVEGMLYSKEDYIVIIYFFLTYPDMYALFFLSLRREKTK